MTHSRLTRIHRAAWASLTALAFAGVLALSVPAQAQVDLEGGWALEDNQDFGVRLQGPQYADYAGIPLNDAGRASALSYAADTIDELQRQCEPWGVDYLLLGPFGTRMWPTVNHTDGAVVSWNLQGAIDRMPLSIWMDGRKPPSPLALRTFAGYAIGHWNGNTLIAEVTGMKDGYLTRHGVPESNQAKLTMFFTRHDQLMDVLGVLSDPVYLTQPFVLSRAFRAVHGNSTELPPMTCQPQEEVPSVSDGAHIATALPGQNPMLKADLNLYNLPLWATGGGADTMYPEFQKRLQKVYKVPTKYCSQYCCGTGAALARFGSGPMCGPNNQ